MVTANFAPNANLAPTGLLIAGEWQPGAGTFEVINPATETVVAQVANASADHAEAALAAASAAAPAWAGLAPRTRSDVLMAAFAAVLDQKDRFAHLITAECGKPLQEAQAEVTYGAEFVRWYAEEAVRLPGFARRAPAGQNEQIVLARPVGPVLAITPWNFPLAMATRKIAPALAAGCPVIVKPAESTPLTTAAFAEIVRAELARRGLPVGALGVLQTDDPAPVVNQLLGDPRLRKLSFTGSTAVGTKLLEQAAQNVLRTSMELGGNAPFIVFDDADLDRAVTDLIAAKMRNAGQTCVAANRVLVAESVAGEFVVRLQDAFASLKVGDPTAGADIGPLINRAAVDHMEKLVSAARAAGSKVVSGGTRPAGPGFFYPPTLITDVAPTAEILQTEIFGPVTPVTTFSNEKEAVALANDTRAGLVAYVQTRDQERALRLTRSLEVGMIGVNRGLVSDASAPFGGVKHSGLGREGGAAGITEYLETCYIAW